jgi:hypothetical protein
MITKFKIYETTIDELKPEDFQKIEEEPKVGDSFRLSNRLTKRSLILP